MSTNLTLAIFILVYLTLAIGHLPGFRLDRTGAVMVGAMLLIALERISSTAAWSAIDYRTIGLLFGLMVVSADFYVAGFYDWAARKVGSINVGPKALLAILIAVSGGLSALLTNDVVVVAMTPVLITICLGRGLNPVPFLLGFCFAANVGSAATLIGSPQNMIAAEALHLSFAAFVKAAAPPAILGLGLAWLAVVFCYRGNWQLAGAAQVEAKMLSKVPSPIPLNLPETFRATLVTVCTLIAFVATDWPHMLIALMGASLLMLNRRFSSQDILAQVNLGLLLLLIGLFVINATLAETGLPAKLLDYMRSVGLDLHDPPLMLLAMAVLSDLVGNNPAVMLVAPYIGGSYHPAGIGAAIALGTGFSSNGVIFGSLAGIIVVEESRKRGIIISFVDFAKAGMLTAALCLLLAAGWIAYLEH
jgi:Na+/H+ antiporter NhaD/arsenite permease-like protein